MKHQHVYVGALLCVLFISIPVSKSEAQVSQDITCRPEQYPGMTVSGATNKCLELARTALPGMNLNIVLDALTYEVSSQIECKAREAIDGVVNITFQGPSRSRKARLRAHRNFGIQELFRNGCSNMTFRNIILDGNKDERDYITPILGWEDGKLTYHRLCDASDWRSANLILNNVFNVTLEDVESVNTACGTAIGIRGGERIVLKGIRAEDNGFEPPKILSDGTEVLAGPGLSYHYSDDITSEYCKDCYFGDLFLSEGTDIGLALGGGPGNTVERVTCTHKRRRGLTCISVGRFGTGQVRNPQTGEMWDGYHDGLVIQDVVIEAEAGYLSYGVTAGTHPYCNPKEMWCREAVVHDGGVLRRISISGAKVGYVEDGLEKIEKSELTFGPPLGELPDYFIHCNLTAKHVVGHVKAGVKIDPQAVRMSLDWGQCGPQ